MQFGEAIGWLLALFSVLTVLSALLVFRTRTILNFGCRTAGKFGAAVTGGASSRDTVEAQDHWRWRARHRPGNFWGIRWPVRITALVVLYFAVQGTFAFTFLHLDLGYFRAQRQIMTMVNESDTTVHYRYTSYKCADGPNAYFDDSISLGDPRLKPLQPGTSVTAPTVMDYDVKDESRCHRFGVVNDSGRVVMLETFTSRELNERKWRVALSGER